MQRARKGVKSRAKKRVVWPIVPSVGRGRHLILEPCVAGAVKADAQRSAGTDNMTDPLCLLYSEYLSSHLEEILFGVGN